MHEREACRMALNGLVGAEYSQRVAELIFQFGETENVNDCGVYQDVELVQLPAKETLELKVAQGSDNLWRYGYLCWTKTTGTGTAPNFLRKGYTTKELALGRAAEKIMDWGKRYLSDADIRVVADYADGLMEQAGEQLSLF